MTKYRFISRMSYRNSVFTGHAQICFCIFHGFIYFP
uniref:Uncharacterized protein n=1 Tax=Anguilla anguilla TaxID=7936 RepID=A0A0E9VPP4_ANGAN